MKTINIDEKLKQIILRITNEKEILSKMNDNLILTRDFGFDSVQIIELIVEIENEFGIEIEDEELDVKNLTEYQKLRTMIERKLN